MDIPTEGLQPAVPGLPSAFMVGDFDGDAWPDLASGHPQSGLGGEVWIWSGAELHAAYAAYHPVHP